MTIIVLHVARQALRNGHLQWKFYFELLQALNFSCTWNKEASSCRWNIGQFW